MRRNKKGQFVAAPKLNEQFDNQLFQDIEKVIQTVDGLKIVAGLVNKTEKQQAEDMAYVEKQQREYAEAEVRAHAAMRRRKSPLNVVRRAISRKANQIGRQLTGRKRQHPQAVLYTIISVE